MLVPSDCPKACGICCRVICLSIEVDFSKINSWYTKHLHEVSLEKAESLNPHIGGGGRYFICDLFDYENNRCLDYNNRPYMCREFPGYRRSSIDCNRISFLPDCYYANQVMLRR